MPRDSSPLSRSAAGTGCPASAPKDLRRTRTQPPDTRPPRGTSPDTRTGTGSSRCSTSFRGNRSPSASRTLSWLWKAVPFEGREEKKERKSVFTNASRNVFSIHLPRAAREAVTRANNVRPVITVVPIADEPIWNERKWIKERIFLQKLSLLFVYLREIININLIKIFNRCDFHFFDKSIIKYYYVIKQLIETVNE